MNVVACRERAAGASRLAKYSDSIVNRSLIDTTYRISHLGFLAAAWDVPAGRDRRSHHSDDAPE